MLKSVFLSFARLDRHWVQQFKDFLDDLRDAEFDDYQAPGRAAPIGDLDEWIHNRVDGAAVIVVVLSENYIASPDCLLELDLALKRFIEGKVVLAPVIIDKSGRWHWEQLKTDPRYGQRLKRYIFADFCTADGPEPFWMQGRNQVAIAKQAAVQKVQRLVAVLAAMMALPPGDPPPLPAAARAAAAAAGEPGDHNAARGPRSLVILGDPTHEVPHPEIVEHVTRLSGMLADLGLAFRTWPHAWKRREADLRDKVKPPATFLRVVTPLDFDEDEALRPRTLRWINQCGRVEEEVDGEVVLWRPGDGQEQWDLDTPPPRPDSAEALADWLASEIGPSEGDDLPLLLIIDEPQYDALDQAPYGNVVKMVTELTNIRFPRRSMNAEQFRKFVVDDTHRKLIVAILDNNVNPTSQGGVSPVERFEETLDRWREEIEEINRRKDFKVEVVWVAVAARLAHLMPNATWNKRTEKPINVLTVFRREDELGQPRFEPDESSALRVANSLMRLVLAPQP